MANKHNWDRKKGSKASQSIITPKAPQNQPSTETLILREVNKKLKEQWESNPLNYGIPFVPKTNLPK